MRRMLAEAGDAPRYFPTGSRGVHATLATAWRAWHGEAVAESHGPTFADTGMTVRRHYIDSDAAADAQTKRVSDALVIESVA